MMIKSDFSELERLLGFIDEVKNIVHANEERAVMMAGNAYVSDVQKVAMVDTGQYRNSIRADLSYQGGHPTAVVGSPMPQTRRLEFGFRGVDSRNRFINQRERPHWRAMWYPHLGEYIAIMERELLKDVHMK